MKQRKLRTILSVGLLLLTVAVGNAQTLKPLAKGIMDRDVIDDNNVVRIPGDITDSNNPSNYPFDFVDYVVANVKWRDLERATADGKGSFQKTDGTDMIGWQKIGEVIRSGKIKGIRLRILAGIHAPDFVKRLGHTPQFVSGDGIDCSGSGGIAIMTTDGQGCSSFFWTGEAIAQYRQLMVEVARRYDNTDPAKGGKILDVVNTGCMSIYGEPFYRAHEYDSTNQRLSNAGFSESLDLNCQEQAMAIHNDNFQVTRTSLAVNSWDIINSQPPDYHTVSWDKAKTFVDKWRNRMGNKLVLQNNGLGEQEGCRVNPDGTETSLGGPEFCYLKNKAPAIGFQTETFAKLATHAPDSITGLRWAVDNAIQAKARFVEVPYNYVTLTGSDLAKLKEQDQALQNQ